jgi:hypothetical protein
MYLPGVTMPCWLWFLMVEQVIDVLTGGHDARLAPAPGNLFYKIGTYLYELATAFATTQMSACCRPCSERAICACRRPR